MKSGNDGGDSQEGFSHRFSEFYKGFRGGQIYAVSDDSVGFVEGQ